MILKNNKNVKKEVSLYLKLEIHGKEYLIIEDNNHLYAGLKVKDILKKISNEEGLFLEEILEKLEG